MTITVPVSVADRADEAIAVLLEARTDRYAWLRVRDDDTVARALRDLHLIVFTQRLAARGAA